MGSTQKGFEQFDPACRWQAGRRVPPHEPLHLFSPAAKMQTNPFKSTIRAHLYVWDEPLNYIDVYSRIQIENLIRQFRPTMVLVEHDAAFRHAVSTDVIPISNRQEGCPACPCIYEKTPEIKISGVLVETNGLEPSTSCV